jgi:hypothetical protein
MSLKVIKGGSFWTPSRVIRNMKISNLACAEPAGLKGSFQSLSYVESGLLGC